VLWILIPLERAEAAPVHPCTRCIGASLHGTPSEAGGSMRALVEPERRFMPPASCGHSCASMRSRHSGFLPSTAPTVSLVFAFPPLMAHPSTDKLWASARRGADREVCASPTARRISRWDARDPKLPRAGSVRHRGALSFGYFSFARAKKSNLPWVSHPQIRFLVAPVGRSTASLISILSQRERKKLKN
jgi:hypothetical protein